MKIAIYVATYNRLETAKICLKNLYEMSKNSGFETHIMLTDDNSSYLVRREFAGLYDEIKVNDKNLGIEFIRKENLIHFSRHNFDYAYLTDSDAFHDPDFLKVALETHDKFQRLTSLYNTIHHETFGRWQNYTWGCRSFCPGISMLLHRESMLDHLMQNIGDIKAFDFDIPKLFNNEVIIPRVSYVDHYGANGLHSVVNQWDRDRAINATDFLFNERQKNIKYLQEVA